MTLLLGATGHLGQAFTAELRRRGIPFTPLTRGAIDYTRFDVLFKYVRNAKPGFLINAAGYPGKPNIDACEIERAETLRANTLLPQTVARVCYLTNTPWGHVSSGAIYSGARVAKNGDSHIERDLNKPKVRQSFEADPSRFRGFVETDEPNFSFRSLSCNFYSGTKALAEEALRWFNECYIWRPQLIFDEFDHPRNLLSNILRCSKVHDCVNSLSHTSDFVRACLDLRERGASFGTYNIVNPGATTTRVIVEKVQAILKPNRPFEYWESDEAFYSSSAKAPRSNCILDASKLLAAGVKMRPLGDALEDALQHWQTGPAKPGAWEAPNPSMVKPNVSA